MKSIVPPLTRQELEIMKMVWDRGEVPVRDVYEAMRERRPIAYTTVMTMMGILERKGHLRRRRDRKAFLYRPVRSRDLVVRSMVREFVDRVFNGAAQPLLVHLVGNAKLTEEERQELLKAIQEGA